MIGTYNTKYTGEVLAPEHLFQSIPDVVSKDDVISAASGLAERAVGIAGLLTTNGGALNEGDTLRGLFALEAVIDQLNVVLHHRTEKESKPARPVNAGPESINDDLIALSTLNVTATCKAQALLEQIESLAGEGTDAEISLFASDVKQLRNLITDVESGCDYYRSIHGSAQLELSDVPESYLFETPPVFNGLPHGLVHTILVRSRDSLDVLTSSLVMPINWRGVDGLVWAVRGQLDMVDKVLNQVAMTGGRS